MNIKNSLGSQSLNKIKNMLTGKAKKTPQGNVTVKRHTHPRRIGRRMWICYRSFGKPQGEYIEYYEISSN